MPNPQYDLQHATATGGTTDCGNILVSMSNDTPPKPVFQYLRCRGNPSGPTISTAVYTAKAGGNGTATNPAPGDTLNLGGFQVTGDDGNLYTFSNAATYRAPGSGPGGYFTAPGLMGAIDDWDAANPGGPDPKGKY